jgi:hypothetical protein
MDALLERTPFKESHEAVTHNLSHIAPGIVATIEKAAKRDFEEMIHIGW